MAYSTIAVANTILEFAEKKKIKISPMKMQKLIYYAQAWYYSLNNEPLVDEHFSRWQYGPVIPSLYHELKYYGSNNITSKIGNIEFTDNDAVVVEPVIRDNLIGKLLDKILDVYGSYSAEQLSNMTHQKGTAWAIKGADGSVITLDEMKKEVEWVMSKGSLNDIKVKLPPENDNNLDGIIDEPPKSKDYDIEERRVSVSIKQEQFEREKSDRQLRDKYSFKAFKVVKKSLWGWAILLTIYASIKFFTRHDNGGFEIFSDQVLIAITTATTLNIFAAFLSLIRGLFPSIKEDKKEK